MPRLALLTILLALPALAQDFESANRQYLERSYSRACEGLGAWLSSHPGDREAQAKRAAACLQAGQGASWEALKTLADTKERDFARAVATFWLFQRGERSFELVEPLLLQARAEAGRRGAEASAMLEAAVSRELEHNQWNVARTELVAAKCLQWALTPALTASCRFHRARSRLNAGQQVKGAEAELTDVGAGSSDVADDALFLLASRREGEQRYAEALELYQTVVRRFDAVKSNVRSNAQSSAENIRRPYVTLSVAYNELPGVAPEVQVSFRNVKRARYTVRRVDPFSIGTASWPSDPATYPGGTPVKSWAGGLSAPGPWAPGQTQFELPVATPGLYVIDVDADGQHGRQWALISRHVVITKSDRRGVTVAVFDAETGEAQPDAEVAVFERLSDDTVHRTLARTDAQGLARVPLTQPDHDALVWTRKGDSLAWTFAGSAWWSSSGREQLAYLMTDRPLYKPGETVGLKLFLRTREAGPSTPLAKTRARVMIVDPLGKTVLDADVTSTAFGTATLSLPLLKSAPLGLYTASVTGPVSFRTPAMQFRVEEYKPPEAVVSVEGVGAPKPGEPVTLRLKASYFSGGPLPNATGRALVSVQSWSHQFGPWPGADEDPAADEPMEEEYLPVRRRDWYPRVLATHTLQFRTGADGTAEVQVPGQFPAADQQLIITAIVTDSSRREVEGHGTFHLSRQPHFVDVRTDHDVYRPGERVGVRLRGEDANQHPVDAPLLVRLSRITDAGLKKFAEVQTPLEHGAGHALLDADALGPVRVEVFDAADGEHPLTSTDIYLTNADKPLPPAQGGFRLLSDRGPLHQGTPLRVLVSAERPGGHVLLTLEGEELIVAQTVALQGRARYVELPLDARLAPNAWVLAMRAEDLQVKVQQRAIHVRGSDVEFPVTVDFGRASAEPGSELSVQLDSRVSSRPLESALTIVDEALFSIEPERTDFLSFFGRTQRQLAVVTRSSFNSRSFEDRRAPAPEATLDNQSPGQTRSGLARPAPAVPAAEAARDEDDASPAKRKSAEGEPPGDGQPAAQVKARTDFSSSAGWFPSLTGTRVTQRTRLPDSLTSWKAVATVVSQGPELGQGSAHLRAVLPLMVRLQAPRFFVEGDEVILSAVIESHLARAQEVEVELSAAGFRALGPSRAKVHVEPEGLQRFDAKFKVVALGDRLIRATVRGGGASDAMEWTLPAFVHGAAQRQFFSARTQGEQQLEFDLPHKRKAALTKFELTLSPTLLSVMFDALPYLAEYPYGCVEQTLSRFVPATVARRAARELHLPEARLPPNLDDMTARGLERLVSFQHADGGWGWWHDDATNPWMTAYVVSSLALAKAAGLEVRKDVIDRGRAWIEGHLGASLDDRETHAWLVYALATTGPVPSAALDTVFSRRTSLSPRARAQLALALQARKDPRARIAVENLDDVVKAAQARSDASVGEATDAWNTSAAIEATAFTLMAYVNHDVRSPLIAPLTDFLVLRRNGGRWRNTRDTAFATLALAQLARAEGAPGRKGAFVISVNGREVRRVPYSAGGLDLRGPVTLGDDAFRPGRNVVSVKHDGAGTGYFAAALDVFNMNELIRGVGGDVKVKRTYTLLGKPGTDPTGSVGAEYGMPVESGVRVRVELEVTANKAVEFVLLEDLKPAGFEAVALQSGPAVCNYQCAHAELRTDRVALFLPEVKVGTTRLSYELRAEVPGRFAALPARVEAMYAPELTATADEMRFEVTDPR